MSPSLSSSCEKLSRLEVVSMRRGAASAERSSRPMQRKQSSRLLLLVPQRKLYKRRNISKRATTVVGWTHYFMIYVSSMALLFQNNQYAIIGVAAGDAMLPSGTVLPLPLPAHGTSTDTNLLEQKQLPENETPEIIANANDVKTWEDDDDDVYETIVAASEEGDESSPSNTVELVQEAQLDEGLESGNDVVVLDGKDHDIAGSDTIIDEATPTTSSHDASQADEGVVEDMTSEQSNDDEDDDKIESIPVQNNDADTDVIPAVSDISPDNHGSETFDSTEDVESASVEESTSVEDTHDGTVEETEEVDDDDDDDDDDNLEVEIASENAVDVGSESGNEFKGASPMEGDGQSEDTTVIIPNVDNMDNGDVFHYSDSRVDNNRGESTELDDTEDVSSVIHIDAEEMYGGDSVTTAYHRSQSIEGDDIGSDESPIVDNLIANAESLEGTGDGAPNTENAGNENSLPTDGIDNNNSTEEGPNDEDPNLVHPIQGWEDEEEGSFFEMIQSTFNMLLFAALLTSILVLRKRVLRRLSTNSSLSLTDAVLDEMGDIVLKVKSWIESHARGGSGANVEGRGNSLTRTNGSFRAETTPLSTAVDEEWGWGDEDVSQRLELSAMGGDEEKEDEDLALALAMSMSESHNDRDDFDGSMISPAPPAPKRFDKKSPPAKPSKSNSARFDSSSTREETQRKSFTPQPPSSALGGGDSIEDLLGQFGGNGGPMITSLGQKRQEASKPKQTQQNGRGDDDIFDSMGLSSYPSTTGSTSITRPTSAASGGQARTVSRVAAPKSAPVQSSLLADTIDADTDSWGDDGDLDDLLDN